MRPIKNISETLIKVKVRAGAADESLCCISADSFVVSVREEALEGRANERVRELLQERFGPRAIIKIVRGHRSPSKIFSVQAPLA